MLLPLRGVITENFTNYGFMEQPNAFHQLDGQRNALRFRRNSIISDEPDEFVTPPNLLRSLQAAEQDKVMPQGKGKKKKKCAKREKNKEKERRKQKKFQDFIIPLIVGLMTAKSIIAPFFLKALTILATKGIILGLISIIMASVLAAKSLLEPTRHYDIHYGEKTRRKTEFVPEPTTEQPEHRYYEPQIHQEKKNFLVVRS